MIEFENDARWDAEQVSVLLWATRDRERIKCLVRGEALDGQFGSGKNEQERLAAFTDNRAMIEGRIRDKIESGHLERDPDGLVPWQVVLLPADLQ
ncbi:DUF1488 domain-containing protein [Rhodospirillaceae bacterium SYSU D60014]|uniref:DUF1488 family protein n=1 Tax=Virgifigura deserti TaxID=2268457 RepID=UPI000E665EF6